MKKYLFCAAAVIVFCSLSAPAFLLFAEGQPEIIIYGTEGCGFCTSMKRDLDAEKIPYAFYDVNKDRSKSSEMWSKVHREAAAKHIVFPVIDIGGKILISPKFEEVKKLIPSNPPRQESGDYSAGSAENVNPGQAGNAELQKLEKK